MPSRVTIFNNAWGTPIAELTTATTRSWILNDVGRCQFSLATFTDANCARDILQYGNFVLVEHLPTIDESGNARGKLPDWIGIILPPQEWEYGKLTVTAYTAEQLLKYRPMPYVTATGNSGTIAGQIAAFGKRFGGYPINPGQLYLSPRSTTVNLRLSALEELQNLSSVYAEDFDVSYALGYGRHLNLFVNWYSQKGVRVQAGFTEGAGGNMKMPKLTEQGEIVNVTEGYNVSNDPTTRISSEAINLDSIADYNRLGQNQNFNVQGAAAVGSAATSYNNLHTRPHITLELTALDVGQTFGGLVTGNVWDVVLKSVGFYGGQIGFQAPVRLTGIEYDDLTNEATLTTKVITSGLTEANYA